MISDRRPRSLAVTATGFIPVVPRLVHYYRYFFGWLAVVGGWLWSAGGCGRRAAAGWLGSERSGAPSGLAVVVGVAVVGAQRSPQRLGAH